jgi:hypothetical protein
LFGSDLDFNISRNLKNHSNSAGIEQKYSFAELSRVSLNLHIGFQLRYNINESLSLTISPEFAKYITPNVKYNLHITDEFYCKINQYYYYGQIKLGVIYKK